MHHLAYGGRAGFVLANGSMSSGTGGEGRVRRALVEADIVDCMVALPPQLFYNTQIPACLWFIDRSKPEQRQGQTLFIDARDLGRMINRRRRELTGEDVERIAAVYHAWRQDDGYEDVPGFCASATLQDIAGHGYVLTPGRYVGFADVADDGEPFEEKMERLTLKLQKQFAKAAELEQAICENLRKFGYDD